MGARGVNLSIYPVNMTRSVSTGEKVPIISPRSRTAPGDAGYSHRNYPNQILTSITLKLLERLFCFKTVTRGPFPQRESAYTQHENTRTEGHPSLMLANILHRAEVVGTIVMRRRSINGTSTELASKSNFDQ